MPLLISCLERVGKERQGDGVEGGNERDEEGWEDDNGGC